MAIFGLCSCTALFIGWKKKGTTSEKEGERRQQRLLWRSIEDVLKNQGECFVHSNYPVCEVIFLFFRRLCYHNALCAMLTPHKRLQRAEVDLRTEDELGNYCDDRQNILNIHKNEISLPQTQMEGTMFDNDVRGFVNRRECISGKLLW